MTRYTPSEHAFDRWHQYTGRSRAGLVADLQESIPFGAQRGDDVLRLLPSGYVAVVTRTHGVRTVLSREHAIVNMQYKGMRMQSGALVQPREPESACPHQYMVEMAVRHAIGDASPEVRRQERHHYSRGSQSAIATYEAARRACEMLLDNIRNSADRPTGEGAEE